MCRSGTLEIEPSQRDPMVDTDTGVTPLLRAKRPIPAAASHARLKLRLEAGSIRLAKCCDWGVPYRHFVDTSTGVSRRVLWGTIPLGLGRPSQWIDTGKLLNLG